MHAQPTILRIWQEAHGLSPVWNKFQWILNQNTIVFNQWNAFENGVCKMADILSLPRPRWRWFYRGLTQQHFVEFRHVTLDRMSHYTDVTCASRRVRPKENSIICLNHNGVETRGCVLSVVDTYLGTKTQGHPYLLCWLHINCNRQFAYKSIIPSSSQQQRTRRQHNCLLIIRIHGWPVVSLTEGHWDRKRFKSWRRHGDVSV